MDSIPHQILTDEDVHVLAQGPPLVHHVVGKAGVAIVQGPHEIGHGDGVDLLVLPEIGEEPAEMAAETIECPRCKLPQKGIDECEYCGLVFKEKSKTKETFPSKNLQKDSLTNCRFCKAQISRNAESCPHCGKPQIIKTKKIVWIGIAAFIILFSLVIPYFLEQN